MAIVKEVDLKVNSKQAEQNVKNLNEQLEIQADVLMDLDKQLAKVAQRRAETSKGEMQKLNYLDGLTAKIKANILAEKAGLKELNLEKSKALRSEKEAKQAFVDSTKAIKKSTSAKTGDKTATQELTAQVDHFSGGAVSGFNKMLKSVMNVVKGMNFMKIAIIGTGIGALVIGIIALVQAFKRSSEGQNKFAKIMAVIGSVVDNLMDAFAGLGEGIIAAVENPTKAWDSFTNKLNAGYQFIKSQIIDRFGGAWKVLSGGIQAGILRMRIAWNEFTGDSEEANALKKELKDVNAKIIEGAKQIKKANNAVLAVYKEVKKAITAVIEEVVREGVIAAKIADNRAKAGKIAVALIVDRAKAERKIADLREKAADKEKYTAEERIKFLTEAGKVSQDLTNKEIYAAKLLYDAKVKENAQGKSNKDDIKEEAQLKANLFKLETKRLKTQKVLTSELTRAKKEAAAEDKRIADKKIADAKTRADLEKEITAAEANTVAEKRALELANEKARFEELITRATAEGLATEELKITQGERLAEIQAGFDEIDREAKQKKADQLKADTEKELELEEAKTAAKHKALGQLVSIFGAESAMGRAALIGKQLLHAKELLIDLGAIKSKAIKATAEANLGAVESTSSVSTGLAKTLKLGFPAAIPALIGYAASAVGIVSGVLSATKKTKTVAASLGGGGGGSSPVAPPMPQPAAFNVVGASETSQLADSIGGQSQQPSRAYVVAADVTTSQEMDRNTIEGASI